MLTPQQINQLRDVGLSEESCRKVLDIIDSSTSSLQLLEEQLQLALEGANQAVWDWNYTTGLASNLHWAEMLGYDPAKMELEYPDWHVLLHPDDQARMKAELQAHIDGLTTEYRSEYRVRKKNGEWIWVLSQGRVIEREPNGKAIRIVGTRSDITARKLTELRLRTNEARYRTLFQSANDAIIILSEDIIIDCNQLALEFFRCGQNELIGSTPYYYSPPVQPDGAPSKVAAIRWIEQTIAGEKQVFEWVHRRKDGTDFMTEVSLNPVHLGNEVFVQAIIRDISARKKMEQELQKSEFRFRTLFDDSPIALFEFDISGMLPFLSRIDDWQDDKLIETIDSELITMMFSKLKITNANKAGVKLFGAPGKLDILNSPTNSIVFESKPTILNLLKVMSTGSGQIDEESTIHVAWRPELIEVMLTVSFPERTLMLMAMQDITEKIQARQALEKETERLAVTLRSIGDGVITTDQTGMVTLLNKIAEKMTGWKNSEAVGKPLAEVFHIIDETTRQPVDNPLEVVLNSKKILAFPEQVILVARTGEERVIADSVAPINDTKSQVIGAVLVFRDITAERHIQEEIQRSAKLESLSVLAGGIAHDFNNMLTGILGSLSFIRTFPEAPEEGMRLLSEAENTVLRAKDLTQQLLTFAKGGTPVRTVTTINDLIRETVQFSLRGSKSKCHFELPSDLCHVEVDASQISQVFQNLTINADQAMPKGGTITVRGRNVTREVDAIPFSLANDRYVRIDFSDTGVGIRPEDIPKIFDPYFTTKTRGTGLGLATTYSIIKHHHGEICVSSQIGIGTCFTIYLPSQVYVKKQVEPAKPEQNYIKGTGRILVLDDDDIVRSLLERVLTHFGYEAVLTSDGKQTISEYQRAIAEQKPFAVTIIDLTIPGGMGGLETFKTLRQIDPKIKAIVSSGYSTDPIMANFREHGFIDVAIKPYKITEMGELIKRAIESK